MIAEGSESAARGWEPQHRCGTTPDTRRIRADARTGAARGVTAGRAVVGLESGVERAAAALKPRMRGWLHAGMFSLALTGAIVLIALSPSRARRRQWRPARCTRRRSACCSAPARCTTRGLGPALGGGSAAGGPREHLPDHRGHVHAPDGADAARAPAVGAAVPGAGRGRSRPRLVSGAVSRLAVAVARNAPALHLCSGISGTAAGEKVVFLDDGFAWRRETRNHLCVWSPILCYCECQLQSWFPRASGAFADR